jgi:hypothetical protein
MLDRIGDVGRGAIDPGICQRAIEQLAGGADERAPGQIFLIARLLAEEQQCGLGRRFAEHGLRRGLPQRAAPAGQRLLTQRGERVGGVAGAGHGGGGDHIPLPCRRSGDPARHQRGFGHVFPLLPWDHRHPGSSPG